MHIDADKIFDSYDWCKYLQLHVLQLLQLKIILFKESLGQNYNHKLGSKDMTLIKYPL